ncbi:MAG: hypothetical protein ABUK01_18810 [Leptospirales bacterium]
MKKSRYIIVLLMAAFVATVAFPGQTIAKGSVIDNLIGGNKKSNNKKKNDKKKDKKKNKKTNKKKSNDNKSNKTASGISKNPVTAYSGKIGSTPVWFFLQKNKNQVIGYYFYSQWAKPLALEGTMKKEGQSFWLNEYDGTTLLSGMEINFGSSEDSFTGNYAGNGPSIKAEHIITINDATIINSESNMKKLMGEHLLSLQWISWDDYGNLTVFSIGDKHFILGQQHNYNGDSLFVVGNIQEINKNSFTIDGVVFTKVKHLAGGKQCVRDGKFTFTASGSREYWRLQQMYNKCSDVTDYVDIYFARPNWRHYELKSYIIEWVLKNKEVFYD